MTMLDVADSKIVNIRRRLLTQKNIATVKVDFKSSVPPHEDDVTLKDVLYGFDAAGHVSFGDMNGVNAAIVWAHELRHAKLLDKINFDNLTKYAEHAVRSYADYSSARCEVAHRVLSREVSAEAQDTLCALRARHDYAIAMLQDALDEIRERMPFIFDILAEP